MINSMGTNSGFNHDFNRAKRRINIIIAIRLIFCVAIIAAVIYGIVLIVQNPEAIGEFFGRISSGFNSVK